MLSDNDCNYREELVKSFISESNGGISVFIACTGPKIWKHKAINRARMNDLGWVVKELTLFRPPPFASYYDTIFSNKISRRVFTPLLNKSHHCNPHKITFQTGGQVPSEHYTKRNNHIFTHRLAKDSKFHIHKILNISWTFSSFS
jgi:hypothetical protein